MKCFLWGLNVVNVCGQSCRRNKCKRCPKEREKDIKKKQEWNRVDVFPWGDSCLLDDCLKIVNSFSMDIYHFPVDVHPNQLPFIKVDRPGERGRGSRADGEQSQEEKSNVCFETLLRTVSK